MTNPGRRPTICLTMIVRDEAHIVTETLATVVDLIDRWVIVDTGSTDETPRVIEDFFASHGLAGELHHRPWVDFATNRTEALRLVGTADDYAWMMDADDLVVGDLDLLGLYADAHDLRFGPDTIYWRPLLFSTRRPWRYEGVLHEYAVCDDGDPVVTARVPGDYHVVARTLGARSQAADKYDRDCAVLEGVIERDPTDARAWFYLAQSHRDAGRPAEAADCYQRRVELGGWDEERFVAGWRCAQCLEAAHAPHAEVVAAHLAAHELRPTRAEPLCDLARIHRQRAEHHLAHLFARRATELAFPADDALFVDAAAHAWQAEDEAAIAAHWTGQIDEAFERAEALLWSSELPPSQRGAGVAQSRLLRGRAPDPTGRPPRRHRGEHRRQPVR